MAKRKKKNSDKIKISACWIVKNAAQDLKRSIDSVVKYVDELIVVDTGSTDDTIAVAEKFGAKIIHEPWRDDFSTPRNLALQAASGDWVVFLDADEFFVNDTAKNLQKAIRLAKNKNFQGISVSWINVDADNGNKIIETSHAFRIFENAAGLHYVGKIHETPYIGEEPLTNITMLTADLLALYHTGYSTSIVRAKLERNLKLLLEELATSDKPERTYSYLTDCYFGLGDWANAEKFARLHVEKIKSLSTRPIKILLEILSRDSAREDEYLNCLKLAVENYPKVPEFSAKLAKFLALRGDYNSAIDEMRLAIKKFNTRGAEFVDSDFDAEAAQEARRLIETWSERISACWIVKNAAQDLKRSIESVVKFVDELIVVDTGSTDETVAVAEKFGAKIIHEPWQDDFSTPRNLALQAASGSWIVFLDADEYFINDTAKNLRTVIKLAQKAKVQGISVNLLNVDADNDNQIINGSHVVRIFEKAPGVRYVGKIHEELYFGDNLLKRATAPANLLTIYHTGYSKTINRSKAERNLKLLLEELATSDKPARTYAYLVDCYYILGDWANAEKFARLELAAGKNLSNRPIRILIEILEKDPARFDECFEISKLAVELYPKVPEFSAKLAECFAQKKNYPKAVEEMRRALNKAKNYGDAFETSNFDAAKIKLAQDLIERWSLPISACWIVKNAAQDLKRSIDSVVKYVDELIVVDTGSTDETVAVAEKFGAKIIHEPWQDDFATPKNLALQAASGSWIVFLDADEFFVNDTAKNLRTAINGARKHSVGGLYVNFVNVDADNDDKIIDTTHLLRVFEKAPSVHYVGKIHETLYRDGKILESVAMPPADMLTIWHTGYSKSIVRAKLERNLKPLLEELETSDEPERTYMYLADCYHGLGDLANAEKFARLCIEHFTNSILTRPFRVLIDCLLKTTRLDDYIATCKLAVERHPKVPEFSAKLAEGFALKGDFQAAIDEMNLALDKAAVFGEEFDASQFNDAMQAKARELIDKWQEKLSPPTIETLTAKLIELVEHGREREKILQTAEKIFALKPDVPEPLERVASVYVDYQLLDAAEAVVAYLEEKFPPTAYRLLLRARIHFLQKNCRATIETSERALTLEGELVTVMMIHNLLGQAYRFIGDVSKAVDHYKFNALTNSPLAQAKNIRRDEYDNWLFNLHALNVTREEIFTATRGFNDLLADIPRHTHDRKIHAEHKKIRVGYISPDIRFHVVAFFSTHFFMSYDKTRFEVVLYANNAEDNHTAQFKANVDAFRNISGIDAKTVAAQIVADEIDILVDLAGHTANNSLEVLAYKPAPIQISGVGYFDSTGLDTVDYFLADKFTDPSGLNEKFFTEKILRLQHSHFCYVWHDFPHMTTPAPCVKNNFVTFGSFNDFAKVTDEMLALWKKILDGVPNSRLYLKGRAFRENCDDFARGKILAAGIDINRVDLEPDAADYVRCYERVDIALDTFPYPGGGTTCDALYMGVPVITLVGERHNSRFGYSLLMNIGLEELCAFTTEDYVHKAIELAEDTERLREYHLTLRRKMELSPVMDDTIYMGELEEVYEKIFSAWLAEKDLPDFPQEEPPLTEELAEKFYQRAMSYLPLEVTAGESRYNRVDYKRTFYFASKAAQFPAKRDAKLLLVLASRSYYLNDNCGSYEFAREAVDYVYSHGAENFPKPLVAECHTKLAKYAMDNGLYVEGLENYERAFDSAEKFSQQLTVYDGWLLALHYLDIPSGELAAPHFDYQNFFADVEPFTTYHKPHDRIRVGYISGDFRKHAAFSVVFGFMTCHDRSKFEITCYSKNPANDEFTELYRRGIEYFVDVSELSAEELAQKIHDDEIDIAVDLAGHTGCNGLPALVYRPAPVQISGIGYMSTTGLKEIDCFITDKILDPPNQNREQFFSEEFLYMPAQFSYAQRLDLPVPNGAPCVKNNFVTFGTICRYMKITDDMLAVWSEILRRVPTAKLLMRAQEFISNRAVDELYRRMKNLGCDMERVVFRPAVHDYFGAISQIDIMLDAYPYVGGTTNLDALYMGVPVVNLYGERHSTRFGKSILHSVGLEELAVDNVDAYIDNAVALANDFETLDVLHKNLRAMFLNSDSLNPQKYCRALEEKFIRLVEAAHEDDN